MARPRKFTALQVESALIECGGRVSAAARQLRCDPSTVVNYIERFPAVRAARDGARESMVDLAEDVLRAKIEQGDLTAALFALRTLGKRRGWSERVTLDTDAMPMNNVHIYLPEKDAPPDPGEPPGAVYLQG